MDVSPQVFEPCAGAFAVFMEGRLVAACLFHCLIEGPHGFSVQNTLVTVDKRWCARRVLACFFDFPFNILGVTRLWCQTAKPNKRARRLLEKLGFKMEGVARRAWDGKTDAVVYSMLPHEDRWSKNMRPQNG